jgi:heme/copper-type cytochrome/quinol oxidase subunit 4
MSSSSPGRLAALLVVFTLLMPYYFIEQSLPGGSSLRIVAPIWALVSHSGAQFVFEFPLGMTMDYSPMWGLGILIAVIAYFAAARRDISKKGYVIMVIMLLAMQLAYHVVVFLLAAGGFPTTFTPLPIVAVVALLLAPLMDREPTTPWESP